MNILRQITIFLSLFLASSMLYGQSLILLEGPEVKEGTVEDDDIAAYANIKNVSEQPIWFKIHMFTEGLHEGHEAALCWQVCYPYTDQDFVSLESYHLESGEASMYGDFSGHLHPYKLLGFDEDWNPIYSEPVPGESLLRYEFVNDDNAEDKLVYEILFRVLSAGNVNPEIPEIVNISPNPASNVIYLSLQNLTELKPSKAEVYDLSGNLVSSARITLSENALTIDVSKFAQGIYYVTLADNQGNRTKFRTFAIQR